MIHIVALAYNEASGIESFLRDLDSMRSSSKIIKFANPFTRGILATLLTLAISILPARAKESDQHKYRPFIASQDKIQAIMLVPPEHDRGTPADEVDENTTNVAVQVAYQLTKMGIKVLWINDRATSEGLAKLRTLGADVNFVEHILTPRPLRNPYIRDYGPFLIQDMETGKWNSVRLDRRKSDHSDESWLSEYLKNNYGIPAVGDLEIKTTRDSGGNVLMDEQGRCFSAGEIHPILKSLIRCRDVVLLPCRSEVCHADEYLTLLRNETIVTNREEFVPILRKAGYQNILKVPYDPELSFTNVLIVHNTVFMMYLPRLRKEMEQAKAVYEAQRYRVIPVQSRAASAENGALHCLTKEIPAHQ